MSFYLRRFLKLTSLSLFTTFIIILFQMGSNYVVALASDMMNFDLWTKVLYPFVVIILVMAVAIELNYFTTLRESGIPEVQRVIKNGKPFKWYRNIPLMMVNCFITFFAGFGLGPEGPSVYLGGSVAMGINDLIDENDDHDYTAMGAALGFASATLAPLAGIAYLFEELLHRFSWKLLAEITYVIGLGYVIKYFLFPHTSFFFEVSSFLPLTLAFVPIIIGLFSLIISYLFVKLFILFKDFMNKYPKITPVYKIAVMLLVCLSLRYFYPTLLGSGPTSLNASLATTSILIMAVLFFGRFAFTFFSASSDLSGGLVIPLMAIGGLGTRFLLQAFNPLLTISTNDMNVLICCGMIGTFASLTKSWVTGSLLSLSLVPYTGMIQLLCPVLLTILTCALLSKVICKHDDLYELIGERLPEHEETPFNHHKTKEVGNI